MKSSGKECLNCRSSINVDQYYCGSCGQHIREAKLSIREFLGQIFSSFISLDTSLVRSVKHIWQPSFLAHAYVSGQRKKYLHPGRLFIGLILVLTALVLFSTSSVFRSIKGHDLSRDLTYQEIQDSFENLILLHPIAPSENVDSIRSKLFINAKVDTSELYRPLYQLGIKDSVYRITKKDVTSLTFDELVEKHKVEKRWDRFLIRQCIKIERNPGQALAFILGNQWWAVILQILACSLILKLLYVRHNIYYLEHVVLMTYAHSFLFIFLIISVLLNLIIPNKFGITLPIALVAFIIYSFLSMKQYYQQGWVKTILKFFISGIFYLFLSSLIISLVGTLSAAFF